MYLEEGRIPPVGPRFYPSGAHYGIVVARSIGIQSSTQRMNLGLLCNSLMIEDLVIPVDGGRIILREHEVLGLSDWKHDWLLSQSHRMAAHDKSLVPWIVVDKESGMGRGTPRKLVIRFSVPCRLVFNRSPVPMNTVD